jgi:hypothetical protein
MTSLTESLKKGPVMVMTLECETEFPKALKNLMLSMEMQGEAVYKGFPVIDEGEEYWWVQLHLYKNKEDDHKKMAVSIISRLSEMCCLVSHKGTWRKTQVETSQYAAGPQRRRGRYYCIEGNHKSTSR